MYSFKWRWLVLIRFLSVVNTNPLQVSTMSNSMSSTSGKTYCGTQLVEALKYVCVTFPSIFQRPVQNQNRGKKKINSPLLCWAH